MSALGLWAKLHNWMQIACRQLENCITMPARSFVLNWYFYCGFYFCDENSIILNFHPNSMIKLALTFRNSETSCPCLVNTEDNKNYTKNDTRTFSKLKSQL